MEIVKSRPYITMVEGRMVSAYSTLEEAQSHIKFQKDMGNKKKWTILYLKDIEFINCY